MKFGFTYFPIKNLLMKFIPLIFVGLLFTSSIQALTKVSISGNDLMKFSLQEFEVQAGKPVELKFTNEGKLPKIAMGHNLVILKEGISAIAFGGKLCRPVPMLPMLYLILSKMMLLLHPIAWAWRIGGIKVQSTFKPGMYQFVCTFPGHYAMMRGIMVVK